MDIVKWRDSYETGVIEMDSQHQKLIELINKLYRVIRDMEPQSIVNEVLSEMNRYAEVHLHDEERLLKQKNYPEYDHHVALHDGYRKRVTELMGESRAEEQGQVRETYSFLRQWWMEHIVTEDKRYGSFIASGTSG